MTRCCKTASEKVIHKKAETIGELIGNKIYEKIVKPNSVPYLRNVEEIVIPPEKRHEILAELRQVL